jgi:hypothetical protein
MKINATNKIITVIDHPITLENNPLTRLPSISLSLAIFIIILFFNVSSVLVIFILKKYKFN